MLSFIEMLVTLWAMFIIPNAIVYYYCNKE
jgi:hypothetical protein